MASRVRNLSRPTAAAKAVAKGEAPPSSSVLSHTELQRIHDIVENAVGRKAADAAAHRDELRKISEERVKHWPNTIEAARLKKERARKERFDKEEERRKVIDAQEEALAKAKKEQAIRKANVLLYEQNDRIKTFSSKLFLTSVLDEREKQMAMKQERDAMHAAAESQWDLVIAENMRKAEADEDRKAKDAEERMFKLKQAQLKQLAEIRDIKIRARDANIAEGQAIKRAAEQEIVEEIEKEERRKSEQRARAKDLVCANVENEKLRAAHAAKEKEEMTKILEFAKKKEDQMEERKRRVDEKFVAKLSRRQAIIDHQAKLLEEIQAATEEREMKAMRDFEGERAAAEAKKEAARKARQQEIDDFKAAQKRRKLAKEVHEAQERDLQRRVWAERAERMVEEELDERKTERKKAERHQHFLLMQAHEKKMQQAYEKRLEYEEGIAMQMAATADHAAYEDYVNSVMHDYVTRGRSSELVATAARRTGKLKSA